MPKVFRSGVRVVILNVRKFFILERQKDAFIIPLQRVHDRVAAATGNHNIVKKDILSLQNMSDWLFLHVGTYINTQGLQCFIVRENLADIDTIDIAFESLNRANFTKNAQQPLTRAKPTRRPKREIAQKFQEILSFTAEPPLWWRELNFNVEAVKKLDEFTNREKQLKPVDEDTLTAGPIPSRRISRRQVEGRLESDHQIQEKPPLIAKNPLQPNDMHSNYRVFIDAPYEHNKTQRGINISQQMPIAEPINLPSRNIADPVLFISNSTSQTEIKNDHKTPGPKHVTVKRLLRLDANNLDYKAFVEHPAEHNKTKQLPDDKEISVNAQKPPSKIFTKRHTVLRNSTSKPEPQIKVDQQNPLSLTTKRPFRPDENNLNYKAFVEHPDDHTKAKELPPASEISAAEPKSPSKIRRKRDTVRQESNGKLLPHKENNHVTPEIPYLSEKRLFRQEDANFEYKVFPKKDTASQIVIRKLQPKLKVIVVPFSHDATQRSETFEEYFDSKSKHVINNMVQKLAEFLDMTFLWSEVSFLEAWWRDANLTQKETLKRLVASGRLEIASGGWVTPDEACTHYYPLIDQFIEGHQWVRSNLGRVPRTGWSVGPAGHGPTVPYILEQTRIIGTVIQRVHFAWKPWLGSRRVSELQWAPGWNASRPDAPLPLVHHLNFPTFNNTYACAPHERFCKHYDFNYASEVGFQNVYELSNTLIQQYRIIGSLTPHNIALVPLGYDLMFASGTAFDVQYRNYKRIFEYINRSDLFNAEVQFGTLLDYFKAVKERHKAHKGNFPTLKGDFFVYADGVHSYWSGYFTTRPRFKLLGRQFEHQLRTSEILFTLVSNILKLSSSNIVTSMKMYDQLVAARRNLGLFQHHEGITGTSKARVMEDYESKMVVAIQQCIQIQETLLTAVMIPPISNCTMQSTLQWKVYRKPINKFTISRDKSKLIIFNPLTEPRTEVITLQSNILHMKIYDTREQQFVEYQIAPVFEVREDKQVLITEGVFEIMFVASLPAFTAVVFNIVLVDRNEHNHCAVTCEMCNPHKYIFKTKTFDPEDMYVENSYLKLVISNMTGFLKKIYVIEENKENVVTIKFGAYKNAKDSTAYLFKTSQDDIQLKHLWNYANKTSYDKFIIVRGPIATEIKTYHLPVLVHTMTIYHVDNAAFSRGIFLENLVDFKYGPISQDSELFMRIQTDIRNGHHPVFYTDQNGFQYQKRVTVNKLRIEANIYPITTMAWLQDENSRLTVLTNHAQGASAYKQGRLELMLGRTATGDGYVTHDGVTEQQILSQSWLLLESFTKPKLGLKKRKRYRKIHLVKKRATSTTRQRHLEGNSTNHTDQAIRKLRDKLNKQVISDKSSYKLPSELADRLSRAFNYPVQVYQVNMDEADVELVPKQSFLYGFPSGLHIVTLRTISDKHQRPTSSSLMLLHRPGYSCFYGNSSYIRPSTFEHQSGFTGLRVADMSSVTLTGLEKYSTKLNLSAITIGPMEVKTFQIRFHGYTYT